MVAMGRHASHFAEQLAVKMLVPIVAVSDDRALTNVNIPWIFRMPSATSRDKALGMLVAAVERSGPNPGEVARDARIGRRFRRQRRAREIVWRILESDNLLMP